MESLGRRVVDPRTADLAALKATSELRQQLRRGSPEWRRASREEEGLIARVLAGIRQSSTDLNLREPTGNIDARRRNLRFDASCRSLA